MGDVAHIAGSKAGAARYDPSLSEEEAHGYENLIALCKEHHAIVDGREAWYPKVVLLNWKSEHDEAQANRADRSWIRPPKVAILIHDGTQTPVSWWVDRFGKDRIYSDEQLEVIGVLFRLRMFTGTIGTVFETLGNLGSTDVDILLQQSWVRSEFQDKSFMEVFGELLAMAPNITFVEYLGYIIEGNDPTALIDAGAQRLADKRKAVE